MSKRWRWLISLSAGIVVLVAAACVVAGCGSSGTAQATRSTSPALASPSRRSSSPAKEVVVPQIVGERFGRAVRELQGRDLHQASAGFPGSDSSPVMNGCTKIISQAPAAGTKVPKQSTIHVTIGMTQTVGRASC